MTMQLCFAFPGLGSPLIFIQGFLTITRGHSGRLLILHHLVRFFLSSVLYLFLPRTVRDEHVNGLRSPRQELCAHASGKGRAGWRKRIGPQMTYAALSRGMVSPSARDRLHATTTKSHRGEAERLYCIFVSAVVTCHMHTACILSKSSLPAR